MEKPETSNVSQLEAEIKRRQEADGVVDIKLFRAGPMVSKDSLAKGVLDLMNAPVVKDNDLI